MFAKNRLHFGLWMRTGHVLELKLLEWKCLHANRSRHNSPALCSIDHLCRSNSATTAWARLAPLLTISCIEALFLILLRLSRTESLFAIVKRMCLLLLIADLYLVSVFLTQIVNKSYSVIPNNESLNEIWRIFNLILHKIVLEVSILLFLLFYSSF